MEQAEGHGRCFPRLDMAGSQHRRYQHTGDAACVLVVQEQRIAEVRPVDPLNRTEVLKRTGLAERTGVGTGAVATQCVRQGVCGAAGQGA